MLTANNEEQWCCMQWSEIKHLPPTVTPMVFFQFSGLSPTTKTNTSKFQFDREIYICQNLLLVN